MSMVNIRRGEDMFKVSRKTFENIYKPKGYRIVSDTKSRRNHNINEGAADGQDVPISDMNREQLMEFAKAHDIDTSGAKSVSEARKIIKRAIGEARL